MLFGEKHLSGCDNIPVGDPQIGDPKWEAVEKGSQLPTAALEATRTPLSGWQLN